MVIRTFIAIELPTSIQDHLWLTGSELGANLSPRSVRWVKPGNFHLTLRFLGDTESERIPQIGKAIDQAVDTQSDFNLELDKIGCFPNPRKPRIIWVGLRGETNQLNNLYLSIGQALAMLGWEPEGRRFQPHLTIGRVKDRKSVVEAKLPYGRMIESRPYSVTSVSVIESVLKPEGAVYTRISRSIFGGA